MDKSQALHLAAEAFQMFTNMDVPSMCHPFSNILSGRIAQCAAISVVLVASSYSIGIFFEKVLPNFPLLKKNLLGIHGSKSRKKKQKKRNIREEERLIDHGYETMDNVNYEMGDGFVSNPYASPYKEVRSPFKENRSPYKNNRFDRRCEEDEESTNASMSHRLYNFTMFLRNLFQYESLFQMT